MNADRAKSIVSYRAEHGPFQCVADTRKVKGIGAVTFKNAAGFLRVYGGSSILDATAVHPDHYELVHALLRWAAEREGRGEAEAEAAPNAENDKKASKKPRKAAAAAAAALSPLQRVEDIGSARIRQLMKFITAHVADIPATIAAAISDSVDAAVAPSSCSEDDSPAGPAEAVRRVVSDWEKWLSAPPSRAVWAGDAPPGVPPLLRECIPNSVESAGKDASIGGSGPFEGVVKNIVSFGAFVDIGHADGLLHRTKFLSEGPRVSGGVVEASVTSRCKLSELVIGQRVTVWVVGTKPPNRIELDFSPNASANSSSRTSDISGAHAPSHSNTRDALHKLNVEKSQTEINISGKKRKPEVIAEVDGSSDPSDIIPKKKRKEISLGEKEKVKKRAKSSNKTTNT
jgi:hypothetical protein